MVPTPHAVLLLDGLYREKCPSLSDFTVTAALTSLGLPVRPFPIPSDPPPGSLFADGTFASVNTPKLERWYQERLDEFGTNARFIVLAYSSGGYLLYDVR